MHKLNIMKGNQSYTFDKHDFFLWLKDIIRSVNKFIYSMIGVVRVLFKIFPKEVCDLFVSKGTVMVKLGRVLDIVESCNNMKQEEEVGVMGSGLINGQICL